jgi:chemotaxis protein CheD
VAEPSSVIDIFLQPGELYFGDRHTRIRTILGSCVSLVFWHPRQQLGGMVHYMLPTRGEVLSAPLSGRYGNEAMALMCREMEACDTSPHEFRVQIFGGGNMFPGIRRAADGYVGQRNVDAARRMVGEYGLKVSNEHVEGKGHRHLIFDVWSGEVLMRYSPPEKSKTSHSARKFA